MALHRGKLTSTRTVISHGMTASTGTISLARWPISGLVRLGANIGASQPSLAKTCFRSYGRGRLSLRHFALEQPLPASKLLGSCCSRRGDGEGSHNCSLKQAVRRIDESFSAEGSYGTELRNVRYGSEADLTSTANALRKLQKPTNFWLPANEAKPALRW